MASKEAEIYYFEKYPVTLNVGEEYRYDAITSAFDAGVASVPSNAELVDEIQSLREELKLLNEKSKPNHITFDFTKRHRNPSGLHNKVSYLLGKSCWDLCKLDSIIKEIFISPCDLESYMSWTKAISITSAIISGRKELFRDTKEWSWIKTYDRVHN